MRFLNNYPALKVKEYLVVSDVHIGITKDIYDRGIIMPRQSESLAKKLNKLKKLTHARKLIILGDIKHKVHGFSIREKHELERFFSLLNFEEIMIVKGNHDGDIERMIPEDKKIKVKKSFILDDIIFTHGHRNVETIKGTIVIGHNQPHVRFKDMVGAIYTEPVWVKGNLSGKLSGKKLVIMPAFNELCGATVVNKDELLGPIAKNLDKKTAHVYLLDGTDIGTIQNLSKENRKML
jgi:putative SbcD/Mre11-related phosphoesterase